MSYLDHVMQVYKITLQIKRAINPLGETSLRFSFSKINQILSVSHQTAAVF